MEKNKIVLARIRTRVAEGRARWDLATWRKKNRRIVEDMDWGKYVVNIMRKEDSNSWSRC